MPMPRTLVAKPSPPLFAVKMLRCPAARRGPTCFSLFAKGVARRCRASGALSLPRAVPHRAIRVHRAPVLRRCRLHDCVVPRRPPMPTQRAQFANHVPDSLPANASLPGRPPWSSRHGHASFSPVASSVAGSAARATLLACRAPCHVARCACALLRSCGLRPCNPHSLRRAATSNDARAASQVANRCPDSR